jgi:hypothetical protein
MHHNTAAPDMHAQALKQGEQVDAMRAPGAVPRASSLTLTTLGPHKFWTQVLMNHHHAGATPPAKDESLNKTWKLCPIC